MGIFTTPQDFTSGIRRTCVLRCLNCATVAQLVEHLTRNEDVRGSIPRGGFKNINWLQDSQLSRVRQTCQIPLQYLPTY